MFGGKCRHGTTHEVMIKSEGIQRFLASRLTACITSALPGEDLRSSFLMAHVHD